MPFTSGLSILIHGFISLPDTETCISVLGVEVFLFVFVALRPKSTAMVIAGRSVHLTTLFPGQV